MAERDPKRDRPEDEELFARAMEGEGVIPLAGRRGRVVTAKPRPAAEPRDEPRARFTVERSGEEVEGLARGVDRRVIGRLRRGRIAVDFRVDLHGLGQEEARAAVRETLARALAAEATCVAIVHGRGLRSPGGPVLKELIPAWLAEPPHGRRVRAFTTAGPAHGGPGATLVLLAPRRRDRSR